MKVFNHNNEDNLLSRYIDLFSVLYMKDKKKWLTEKEKVFFIHCINIVSKGMSLDDKNATALIKQNDKFSNSNVYVYRDKLKKKGWLLQTNEELIIPPAFTFKSKGVPRNLEFNFKLSVDEKG